MSMCNHSGATDSKKWTSWGPPKSSKLRLETFSPLPHYFRITQSDALGLGRTSSQEKKYLLENMAWNFCARWKNYSLCARYCTSRQDDFCERHQKGLKRPEKERKMFPKIRHFFLKRAKLFLQKNPTSSFVLRMNLHLFSPHRRCPSHIFFPWVKIRHFFLPYHWEMGHSEHLSWNKEEEALLANIVQLWLHRNSISAAASWHKFSSYCQLPIAASEPASLHSRDWSPEMNWASMGWFKIIKILRGIVTNAMPMHIKFPVFQKTNSAFRCHFFRDFCSGFVFHLSPNPFCSLTEAADVMERSLSLKCSPRQMIFWTSSNIFSLLSRKLW